MRLLRVSSCAERFIRTFKKNPLNQYLPDRRGTLPRPDRVQADYNESWLIERHGHRLLAQFRRIAAPQVWRRSWRILALVNSGQAMLYALVRV